MVFKESSSISKHAGLSGLEESELDGPCSYGSRFLISGLAGRGQGGVLRSDIMESSNQRTVAFWIEEGFVVL